MSDLSPSLRDWKALYEAAIEFKKVECWNWMWDSDVFGVKNPATGEIGYCCILGRLGVYFGLAVYLGTEGLKGFLKLQLGDVPESGIDKFMLQKCLMASFKDRAALNKPDLELIKKLGLKFRGRKEWPLFRSHLPGYHPWYLTGEEARFLTLVLQQVVEVALRFKEDQDMLEPLGGDYVFVRVPEKEKDEWRWRDDWLKPSLIEEEEIMAEPVDEVRLERLKETARREQSAWEIDYFYSTQGVSDGKERPYYPYVFIWVDHHSGFIYHCLLANPSKPEYQSEFMEEFLSFIENTEVIPDKILVSKEELFKLLEPVTSGLDIELKRTRRLKEIEQVKAEMRDYFS